METGKAIYRPDIDGLRAIAILSVLLYHAGVPWLPGGFTGVDIFFVISGYLIGGHIFSEIRQGRFSFARFYQRRVKRILPAFYLVLCFTMTAGLVLLSPVELADCSKSAIAAVLSFSNVYFLRYSNYFQGSSALNPLLMTWSLAVEEQFYLVIPLLMLAAVKIHRGVLLPAILATCALSYWFAWHQVHVAPDQAFYLLPSRAWELGAGVAWAVGEAMLGRAIVRPRWAQTAGLCGMAALLTPMYLLNSATPFPGPSAAASVLGTALVIGCPSSWVNRRFLSLPWLVFIGRISYSWYLWHWPLMAFLRVASGGPLPPVAAAMAVALSFALAVLSYFLIEQPFRKSRLAPAPLFARYAGVAVALLVVLAFVWKDHGLPARFPNLEQEQIARDANCMVDYGRSTPDLSAPCYGASGSSPAVLLWGDSHSAALAPALRADVESRGDRFFQLSKSSCLPLVGVAKFVPQHPSVVEECVEFNRIAMQTIVGDSRIRTVILAGRWADPFLDGNIEPLLFSKGNRRPPLSDETGLFVDAMAKDIDALEGAGQHVVVVNDVPNFDFDPLVSQRTTHIPARRLIASWMAQGDNTSGLARASFAGAAARSDAALETIRSRFQNVEFVNLKPMLCDDGGWCAYMRGGRLLYSDAQHLTPDGAFYALRGLSLPSL